MQHSQTNKSAVWTVEGARGAVLAGMDLEGELILLCSNDGRGAKYEGLYADP